MPDEFEAALKAGKQTDWYDDALFYYAEWMNSNGTIRQLDDGQWQQEADYVKALELYRRLTREFTKGETRYYDQAQQQIKNITEPTLERRCLEYLSAGFRTAVWLERAQPQDASTSRLYKVDLTRDVRFTKTADEDEGEGDDGNNWIQKLQIGGRAAVQGVVERPATTKATTNQSANKCASKASCRSALICSKRRAGHLSARDLILVTDASTRAEVVGETGAGLFLQCADRRAHRQRQRCACGRAITTTASGTGASCGKRRTAMAWRRLP